MTTNRLLILDDEPLAGRFISNIAEAAGFTSMITTTSNQFFEELESWAPTHIVLDLMMPDTDGVEVLGKLARKNCRASIIIASAVGNRILDAANRTGKELGLSMSGVIPKPFPCARLRQLLLLKNELVGEPSRSRNGVNLAKDVSRITADVFNRALDNEEIELVYQPKINCRNERLAGFEALARWNCPERGMLSPDRFIPIAETNGLMGKMTRQVIEQAVSWFSEFLEDIQKSNSTYSQRAHLIQELTLSINLSAQSLDDPELFEFVVDQCHRKSIEPRRIVFELTETSAMEDPLASLNILTRLRIQGFQLSIDDFGSGYSSMTQLVRLPFSEIKLDQSFVMAALWSAEARSVIRAIIELGHSLGLVATGEGVEDRNTFQYLRETGCDLAQGHFFSRPVGGSQAIDWAQAHLESWR